jgi:hypothetical protein
MPCPSKKAFQAKKQWTDGKTPTFTKIVGEGQGHGRKTRKGRSMMMMSGKKPKVESGEIPHQVCSPYQVCTVKKFKSHCRVGRMLEILEAIRHQEECEKVCVTF